MTEVMRSRQAVVRAPSTELDSRLKEAQYIAQATQALPQAYRNNPGTVLLAQAWASARGVDILTAIQTVNFIQGRPVIDATMQRALAMRAGYDVTIKADAKSATVTVLRDGVERGEATYTMDDAKLAKLDAKDNWKQNPKAMLVARATTQAMRWFAPDVMVGVFSEDELDHPEEVLAVEVDRAVEADVEVLEDAVDVEIVEPELTLDHLTVAAKALDGQGKKDLAAFGVAQGWPESRADMSSDQIGEALSWIARR